MITDGRFCQMGSLIVDEKRKELQYSKVCFKYCPEGQQTNTAEAVEGIIRFIKVVARLLKSFTNQVNNIVEVMANTQIDDPQLRSPEFMQQNLRRYERVFCMDGALHHLLPAQYLNKFLITRDRTQKMVLFSK